MAEHLKNITIRSFKGLENVALSDCGAVNAIVGKNNSGKSSILHAIDLASLALSVSDWSNFELKLESSGDTILDYQNPDTVWNLP